MDPRATPRPTVYALPPTAMLVVAAGFLLLIGAALMIFGVAFVGEANASAGWSATTGWVEHVRVTWDNVGRSRPSVVREYYYVVTYSYSVNGERYTGTRSSLGGGSNAAGRTFDSEDEARAAAAANYRVGQDVPVYYDPADPAEAVLQTGVQASTYVPLILGTLFIGSGGGVLWLLLRLRQAALTVS